jgi:3-dehydroquinate synthase
VSLGQQRFQVSFDYPVYFTQDALEPTDATLVEALSRKDRRRHRVLAFLDQGLVTAQPDLPARLGAYATAHADAVDLLGVNPIAGGEACKNDPEQLRFALEAIQAFRMDRHSFVVAIGGGAVLDVVGYAASITHRGVRLLRFPTTVLSQADSGVGVKNGVNAYGQKNYFGTFVPPFAVVQDRRLLASLATRDVIAGTAEAVKVGLVRDREFFAWISERAARFRDGGEDLHALVRRSAELHLKHIATSGDPFELGSARPLDYGHWAAHKLESITQNRLRHGEAVAIGMALDACYASRVGLADAELSRVVCATLENLGFSLWDDALDSTELMAGVEEFREHMGGELTVILLRAPGVPVEVHAIDANVVRACIDDLRSRRSP